MGNVRQEKVLPTFHDVFFHCEMLSLSIDLNQDKVTGVVLKHRLVNNIIRSGLGPTSECTL